MQEPSAQYNPMLDHFTNNNNWAHFRFEIPKRKYENKKQGEIARVLGSYQLNETVI